MTLTKSTFKVLNALRDEAVHTQRHIATATGLSLGTVNTAYRALVDAGLAENFSVTPAGFEALSPYQVDNAIIMAAGLSSRFAPLSYEKPKGVLTVRGEVLIERQIRQLREAGITDITVVVGYMKEAFFYLEDKFGVTIRVNAEYSVRNNNSTLMLVREKLGNTYVCSSYDYFTENVFEPYVFEAYYPGVFFAGETNEYLLDTARDGRITGVTIGGRDKYGMLGHVYFDRAFSETFVRILVDEYDRPETAGKLWEDIYRAHLDELRMVMRPYEPGVIFEFDSISDLKEFDHDFIENVDSAILDNICRVLDCSRGDVEGIVPIKEGLTNLSFRFVVRGEEMYLIDWEYSAMSDYASDLGTFICCSDYSVDEARHVIELYFGRTPTDAEMRHCLAYVALAAYYWFVWALYKESTGDPVGEWLYLWYRTAKEYSALALKLYGATPGQVA